MTCQDIYFGGHFLIHYTLYWRQLASFDLPTQSDVKQEIGRPHFHPSGLNAWESEEKERTRGQEHCWIWAHSNPRDQTQRHFYSWVVPSLEKRGSQEVEFSPFIAMTSHPWRLVRKMWKVSLDVHSKLLLISCRRKKLSSLLYSRPQKENMGSCADIS